METNSTKMPGEIGSTSDGYVARTGLRLTIKTKLISGFLIVVALLVAVAAVGLVSLRSVGGAADRMAEEASYSSQVADLKAFSISEWQFMTDYGLTHNPEALDESRSISVEVIETLDSLSQIANPEEKVFIAEFSEMHDQFVVDGETMAAVYVSGDWLRGNQLMAVWDVSGGGMLDALDALEAGSISDFESALENADQAERTAILILTLIAVIATVVAVIIGYLIAQAISTGIGSMVQAANGIAEGDVNQEIDVKSNDEVGDMGIAFTRMIAYLKSMAGQAEQMANGNLNVRFEPKSESDVLGNSFSRMVKKLRGLVGEVTESADQVASASAQLAAVAGEAGIATQGIASTSQDIANGAMTQSTHVSETAEGVQKLAAAIAGIAKGAEDQTKSAKDASDSSTQVASAIAEVTAKAQSATQAAQSADEAAQLGSSLMDKTVQGMGRIKTAMETVSERVSDLGDRSGEIGKIVSVIDDIAAQTNLLALNAAIEAARAGEQGRGFAVVADEVRQLAERVTQATTEIATLIETVQLGVSESIGATEGGASEVSNGIELADETGEALKRIKESASTVNAQVEQIMGAAEEISAASDGLVASIDGVSAVSEETTESAAEMALSAENLQLSMESVSRVVHENSAAAEESSASTEELSAQVEQVVASSESLAQMADGLKKIVSVFKLSDQGDGSSGSSGTDEQPGKAVAA